ncbi:MAG TPA: IS256 family transposase [Pyrinomonadaceae bacterium]|nr:IS256 family transposase [Pyrinomonadaceae bacterium]
MKEYNENRIFDNLSEDEKPEFSAFSLESYIRSAAQRMIQAALEMEVEEFLQRAKYDKTSQSEFRGYRNGHHKSRTVSTAVGGLRVKVPRVSDNPEKFKSKLVEPYQRRSQGLNNLFPKLFIEGLSTRDFEPSLRFLVGEQAPLSPSSISRLNQDFKKDYERWQKSDLSEKKFYYIYADGVYLAAGIALERACLLVIIGIDSMGEKHLLGLHQGFRESKESWKELLIDLRNRGLNEPALAIADGGLGFWAALEEVFSQTKEQLCWLHKTRNILNKLPKREHEEAANRLRAIYLAEDKTEAERLAKKLVKDWKTFAETEKAAECLEKALEKLLTFYEFPTEHARHLRTTNPIESVFATIRLRTKPMKRFRSIKSGVHLVFKLLERAKTGWRGIGHPEKLKEVKLPS